jgi:hypothetical protein
VTRQRQATLEQPISYWCEAEQGVTADEITTMIINGD